MKMHRLLIMGSATAALMLVSCNLFAPSEGHREQAARDGGPYALTYEAKLIMEQQTSWAYLRALKLFDEALSEDSSISEALYYKGKCILRLANIDITQVWNDINPSTQNTSDIPFLFKPVRKLIRIGGSTPTPSSDTLILGDTVYYLRPYQYPLAATYSLDGNTATTVGDSVYLERKRLYDATCPALKMLDYINSKPLDGMIIRKQYESDYLVESSIKSLLGIIDVNNDNHLGVGDQEQISFRVLSSDIKSLDNMNLDSLKTIWKDPKLINAQLASITSTVGNAKGSYDSLYAEISNAGKSTSVISNMGKMLKQFNDVVPFYYYDDYRDNDSNWYNTDAVWGYASNDTVCTAKSSQNTFQDRMIWIDWDNDKLIDINSPGQPQLHIGDAASMFPFGKKASEPYFGLDTTLYSLVDMYPFIASCNYMLLPNGSCYIYRDVKNAQITAPPGITVKDTIDKPLYHRYKYKGPYTYEFIFGDWGVDEEIMDGADNTQDGLTDEDTRITDDTLDDDGDRYPNSGTPLKMVWNDVNSDFTTNLVFSPADSVLKTGKYALLPYVTAPTGNPVELSRLKIPTFILGPTGEFISGNYGVDEEWFDGIDNDGDGLIDEDVGQANVPQILRSTLIRKLSSETLDSNRMTYHEKLRQYWAIMQKAR